MDFTDFLAGNTEGYKSGKKQYGSSPTFFSLEKKVGKEKAGNGVGTCWQYGGPWLRLANKTYKS